MALDLSDPELLRAIASVRSDNTAHNYCVLGYSAKNKLGVTAMGDGPTPWSFVDEMEEDKSAPSGAGLTRVRMGIGDATQKRARNIGDPLEPPRAAPVAVLDACGAELTYRVGPSAA